MENEKKSSRLGVRLSAIMVAVLLVICMAVPAFAATVEPDEYNKLPFSINLPDGYRYYILCLSNSGDKYYVFAFNDLVSGYPRVEWVSTRYRFQCGTDFMRCFLSLDGIVTEDWTATTDAAAFWVNGAPQSDWYGNVNVYQVDGSIFFEPDLPPPPDLKQEVTSGLAIVLDWVGATVSALFSGELSGLLPLVAVPVAITILIVAIVVIKRSIWGA